MTDVVLQAKGKTADGKKLFEIISVAEVPPIVVAGEKGAKKNTSLTEKDDFGILRPARKWLFDLYGSTSDRTRMR